MKTQAELAARTDEFAPPAETMKREEESGKRSAASGEIAAKVGQGVRQQGKARGKRGMSLVKVTPPAHHGQSRAHLEVHVECLFLAFLRGDKAAIDALVVPRVVATREVGDDGRKLGGLLQPATNAVVQHPKRNDLNDRNGREEEKEVRCERKRERGGNRPGQGGEFDALAFHAESGAKFDASTARLEIAGAFDASATRLKPANAGFSPA